MSEPKRYEPETRFQALDGEWFATPMRIAPIGRWVAYEDYAALKAQLDRLTTWQPIETAPMDGTAILGCQGWCIEVTAYHKGTKPYHRKEAWVVANDDEGYAQDFKPTHWMPLPNPNPPVKKTKSKR